MNKRLDMTKTDMLERKISDSGASISDLAKRAGMTENELMRKISGEEEFRVSEIWAIGEFLSLGSSELQEIFLQSL